MKINPGIQTVFSNRLDTSENSYPKILEAGLIAYPSNLRIKRSDDDKTLVDATAKEDYTYPLNLDDINQIIRIEHDHYQIIHKQYEVIGSLVQLKKALKKIFIKSKAQASNEDFETRFTLIIYQPDFTHWSTLVIYGEEDNYFCFYADPKGQALADEYKVFFDEEKIELVTLTKNFVQQQEIYNSALWALENAADINKMIQYKKDLFWGRNELKQARSKEYFDKRRRELSKKLYDDSYWRQLHPRSLITINPEKLTSSFEIFQDLESSSDSGEPSTKRLRVSYKKDPKELLNIFTESFLARFFQQLAAFRILARGNDLTVDALKSELKSEVINGAVGALFGLGISQGIASNSMGVIPSVVASARAITSKLLAKKDKEVAKKITKYFDGADKELLTRILCESAIHVFYSYEYQFIRITDKAGDRIAMEKLADDTVDRAINYLNTQTLDASFILSNELIEKAILQGPSETFFDPRLRMLQLKTYGKRLINDKFENFESEIPIYTARLYEKVGLITFVSHQPNKFYESQNRHAKYGYRRLLDWEKNENGDLKQSLQADYTEKSATQEYHYALVEAETQAHIQSLLDKVSTHFPARVANVPSPKKTNKQAIYFDLREPVADFTGRVEIRAELHRILTKDNNMAVISALSAISISSSTSKQASQKQGSGSQLSISGLGGIGKTQLALQYAKEHAEDYDRNVLWINAETLENLSCSFTKLANKLGLETQDRYGQARNLEAMVEAIYEYFSDRKSLFILDNVENYREIEAYLPKSMLGNKPTILITSRYTNWKNVAQILPLGLFTDQEAIELFKNANTLADLEDIKQLNQLLHGLPLALKQAIAYINLQKKFKSHFSVNDYMELYKEKNHKLLNFDFSIYVNDSYLRTVFTTWLITLDKINAHPKGAEAIDLLFMMAYLDPENISNKIFYPLDTRNCDETDNLIFLLESYSMINPKSEPGRYTIHRLVQQVLRINLEATQERFKEIYKRLRSVLRFKVIGEKDYHNAHFLIYMSEFQESLKYDTIKDLFTGIAGEKKEIWHYFFDLAYLKFTKKKCLDFLGDALGYSVKAGYFDLVYEIFNYLEKKLAIAKFSKENIKYILELAQYNKNPHYRLTKRSGDAEISRQQTVALQIFVSLKARIFDDPFTDFDSCASSTLRRKREICSLEALEEHEKRKSVAIRSHVEKVILANHLVSSGLMGKNVLLAIIRGDWHEVAINFELIASSTILGKISNQLLTQGKDLENQAHLLEENLGLENKKAWSLFLDRELSIVGKKLFLGKSLQVASSFVRRGTDIFFAYNLKKEITAYQEGDKELLPDIISNGVTTGATVAEIGIESLEYFKYILNVAGKVNPYLEAISVLVWFGTEVYEAEEQIHVIQKHVHLSWKEHYIEFVRGFFHYPPSRYLQAKANNAQLEQYALNFLKNHTDFRSYIAPIFSLELALYENNTVLLDHKRMVKMGREVPGDIAEDYFFCRSGIPGSNDSNNPYTYLCHLAMGIQYPHNRSAEINLINLGIGNDTVFALPNVPNYFFVQNGEKKYTGGDEGNIFRLEGNATTGQLSGGKKSDALLLEQFSPKKSAYLIIDHESYLCGQQQPLVDFDPFPCSFDRIKLNGINQIYGRSQQQDVIYLNPDIHFIDGHGGIADHPDVFFITEKSFKNPCVVLRNNTLVLFPFKTAIETMDYQIPMAEMGTAEIQTHFFSEVQHRFFFECALEDILGMHIQNDTLIISVYAENNTDAGTFTITLLDPNFYNRENPRRNVTNFEKNSSYFFQNMEIKLISNDQLFAQEITKINQTIEDYIDRFSERAIYLNRTVTLQLLNNSTLAIGRGNQEIFYADGLFPSHLVGNGGENVYRITTNNETQFPLAEMTLYRLNLSELNEQIDTLDLHPLIKYLKKICPEAEIAHQLSLQGTDFILILTSFIRAGRKCSDVDSIWGLAYIRVKAGLDWYQNLDILLEDSIPKRIVTQDGEDWSLIDNPLVFAEDKHIISLNDKVLGDTTEISLLRNSGNYSCFRNVSDLLISNLHTKPQDACTLVVHDYYHNPAVREKLLSTKLNFLDTDFYLKDHRNLIDEAQNFSDFVKQLEKPGSKFQHPPLFIPIHSGEFAKPRLKRQTPISMEFDLGRQAKGGWMLPLNMSLTVIFSLVGGFYWWSKRRQQAVPVLVAAGLSSLPTVTANQQKISAEESQLDFSSEFSIEKQCLSAETFIGWLSVCQNKHSMVFMKNHRDSCSFYFESYELHNKIFFRRVGKGVWEANRCEISTNILAEDLYPLLPPDWKQQLIEEKARQQRWDIWKHSATMTLASVLVDKLFLCTRVGNILKTLNLTPDWKSREDRYLLNRCGFVLEQQLFQSNRVSNLLSLGSISVELALLHPATCRTYKYLTQQEDISKAKKAKFAVRFLLDILQLGFSNICHLAHILEYCFPASVLVKNISLGLRMSNYFYFLTGDLSYWYLGLALFLLPQIPQLLDHLGIPATRSVHCFCNKLANCLLSQTLLKSLSEDKERKAQADFELLCADARVLHARQHLSNFFSTNTNVFSASIDSYSVNDEGKNSKAIQCLR